MKVEVLVSWEARQVDSLSLELTEGARVAQALTAAQAAGWAIDGLAVSVWGRIAAPDARLREGDRIELTRALRVDPKVARRERFKRQGSRAAGLFARRR